MSDMTSDKPYLLRAMHEWIVDNNLTPYILVNTTYPGTQVPEEYIKNDRIILNIAPIACRGFHLKNDCILFTARFSGEFKQIAIPPAAVLAIYAKENGKGMEFKEEHADAAAPAPIPSSKDKNRKPALTLVKKEE